MTGGEAHLKILLLVLQYPPDVNSTGMLMQQLAEGLRGRGHIVDIVTSVPHYAGFRVAPEYRRRPLRVERRQEGTVARLPALATGNKASMSDRLLSYGAWGALSALGGAMIGDDYDVILATNGGFFTGASGKLLSKLKAAPFVLNVQDLYPDVPVGSGQLREGPAVRALEWMARAMYHGADRVTVITDGMKERLAAKGVPSAAIEVIPNFVDIEFIRPLPKDNPWSRAHGLHDKFVVAHAGNVGFVYDLASVLEAAKRLAHRTDIVFVIVGDGAAKAPLEAKAEDLGLSNILFLPFQPRQDLPWMRATFDVQLAVYMRGSARNSMPSKVYEIMASGRPVLASAEPSSDLARLVADASCGVCIEPEDAGALATAVLSLQEHPALCASMGARGRTRAETAYSREAIVERYESLFARITRSPDTSRRK